MIDEYAKLRSLLLGKEMADIDAIERQLEALIEQSQDKTRLITSVAPVIDSMLREKISDDRDSIVDTLSPIIAEVLSHEIQNNSKTIAKALAPVIGEAIRVQIRTQKDEVIDALYPVIGNTISRYVAQTFKDLLESINANVQDAMSVDNLRRRLIAKIRGVSEAELLLGESLCAQVVSVFLIQKSSGLLMVQRHAGEEHSNESEMAAAMLTAIRDFVNDWIVTSEADAEVNQIEYGGSTICLEVAGYCYLAVVVRGQVNRMLLERIGQTLGKIIEEHDDAIRRYEGDPDTLATETILSTMDPLFEQKKKPKGSSKWLNRIWAVAAMVLIAWVAVSKYSDYRKSQLTSLLNERLQRHENLALYALKAQVDENLIHLSGAVPDESIRKIAQTVVSDIDDGYSVQNDIMVAKRYEKDQRWVTTSIESLRQDMTRSIEAIPMPKEQPMALPSLRSLRVLFAQGKSRINVDDPVLNVVAAMMHLREDVNLIVTGHTDGKGSRKINERLARARADQAIKVLKTLGVPEERLQLKYEVQPPNEVSASEISDGRCVTFQMEYRSDVSEDRQ